MFPKKLTVILKHVIGVLIVACICQRGFCQEASAPSAIVAEKSVKEGINADFKREDLSVEEYLARFEVESREVYAKRREILDAIQVKKNDKVIDLGAGTGFYTFLFAEAVGREGKVLAVDIAPAFVSSIQERATQKKLANVTAQVSTDVDFDAENANYDLIFVCDVYHHFEYPHRMNRRIYEALKKGGRLVVIDFKREEGISRPWVLDHVRAGREIVQQEIEASGLVLDSVNNDLLAENYLMIFHKP